MGLINAMLSPSNGLFNHHQMFGGDPVHFMAEPKYFKTVYVLSDIWQTAGYGSIVYLAALTSIDPSLYGERRRWTARPNGKSCCTSPALHPANDHDDAHPAYGQHLHRGLREDHADITRHV
ncbi:MAG: hypothetical protein ACLRRT_09105 [Ruthenibacterium lactatiformans]